MHHSHYDSKFLRLPPLLLAALVAAPFALRADDPNPRPIALEARGHLVPAEMVTVSPNVAGQVVEIMFDEGSQVKRGDLLVRVDPRQYEAALRLARGKLKLAEAELAKASTQKVDVPMAEAKLEIARAEVDIAQLRLEGTAIRAPISGTVLAKRANVGARLDPKSTTICDLADLQVMEVEVWVTERDVVKIAVGQRCMIRVDAFPDGSFEGVVARLQPVADRARAAVGVRVRFDARAMRDRIRPELSAIVQFLNRD